MKRVNLITISAGTDPNQFKHNRTQQKYEIRDLTKIKKAYPEGTHNKKNDFFENFENVSLPENIVSSRKSNKKSKTNDIFFPEIYQKKQIESFQRMAQEENIIKERWISAAEKISPKISVKLSEIFYKNVLEHHAAEIIHLVNFNESAKFCHVITGPRYSGKTTFLSIFSKEIVHHFSNSGQWKNTFLFSLDLISIKNILIKPYSLYNYIINQVLEQFSIQYSSANIDTNRLKKYFHNACIHQTSISIPSTLRSNLENYHENTSVHFQKIGQTISSFLDSISFSLSTSERLNMQEENFDMTNIEVMKKFYDYIFELPKLISNALGFSEIHFILDHFDEADIEFCGFFIIESIKKTLIQSSFVLSCKNTDHLLESLQNSDDSSIDLCSLVRICDISDISLPERKVINHHIDGDETDLHRSEKLKKNVIFKTTNGDIELSKDDCSGCPNFVGRWEQMMESLVKFEHSKEINESRNQKPKLTKEEAITIDRANKLLSMLVEDPGTVISLSTVSE